MDDPWPIEPGRSWELSEWERWPTGIRKIELWHGCPVFYGEGEWAEGDVAAAERACPGWRAILREEGTIMFLVPPDDPERPFGGPLPEAYVEQLRKLIEDGDQGGGLTLDEFESRLRNPPAQR